MRYFTLLFVSAVMACGTANAVSLSPKAAPSATPRRQVVTNSDRMRALSADKKEMRKAQANRMVRKAASIAQPDNNIDNLISETPAGELKQYEKTGFAYGYNWFEGLFTQEIFGNVVNIVKSDDGKKLYMQNPVYFNTLSAANWIVGDIEGNKVTFTFPQLVDVDATYDENGQLVGDPYYDYALLMTYDEKEDFYVPAAKQTYTLTIGADGSMTADDGEDVMVGMACYWTEDEVMEDEEPGWAWIGNGDYYYSFTPFDKVAADAPADVEFTDWKLVEGVYVSDVQVAFKDDKVYFKGLFTANPDAVVSGTVNGATITVAGGQYIGLYEDNTTYFLSGKVVEGADDEDEFDSFKQDPALVFDYDADKHIIKTDNAYCISISADKVLYYQLTQAPYICLPEPASTVSALPQPIIDLFYDIEEEYGYEAETYFIFPVTDTEMHFLPTDKLYYEVIMDGEVYTFMNDEYKLPDGIESISRVPFGFNCPMTDENPFPELSADGQMHYFILHALGFETLGVRTLYIESEGAEPVYSDITYMPGYSSIKNVVSTAAERSVEFFNLQGRRISAPAAGGIAIRRAVLEDGTVKTTKVSVR